MNLPDRRKLRIAHCLDAVHSGGVERRRLSLVRGLDRCRFEQRVICTVASAELAEEFERHDCKVVPVGRMTRGIDIRRIAASAKVLRDFRPHIVHGAVFEGVVMAAAGGRLARIPIIIGEETADPTSRSWRGHAYYRTLASLTDLMIAVSPPVAYYLTGKLRLPKHKVRIIRNGVHEPPSASMEEVRQVRERFGLSHDLFVIGAVGRLAAPAGHPPDSNKRIGDAISAMAAILRHCPDARLLVVGSGSDQDLLEKHAAEQGVAGSVIFAGYQPRTRRFYDVMDVLVHPSASESFGLVLVEAMFAGLPVVATDVGGIPYVVEDERTGVLVPPRRPDMLAEEILRLWRDPALRTRMGARGLQRARSLFSEQRYVHDIEAVYEELAGRSPASRNR